jgi:threonylcarbamoyladenosine tRNA methylthiotransferase MtaB
LTGVDVSDYGSGLDENINLGLLVKKILKETTVERLRISSIDISKLNKDLEDVFQYESRLMPHIHLSLQSGDDMVLTRMLRRHTRGETVEKCHKLLEKRKELVFGADLIAGFPTESDEMHKNSVKIIEEIPIVFGHIFPYSERPETEAASMPQVAKNVRKQRAKELRQECEKNLNALKKSVIGTRQKVLIESDRKGRLENYLLIDLNGNYGNDIGNIITIFV